MKQLLAILIIMVAVGPPHGLLAQQGAINLSACETTHSLQRGSRQPARADCKKADGVSSQLVGAVVAPDERHTAAILYTGPDARRHICTGVLIDSTHVLTAGHCGCGVVGSYDVSFDQNPLSGDSFRKSSKIVDRPIQFNPLTCALGPQRGMDLALLKLATPIIGIDDENFGYPAFMLTAAIEDQLAPGRPLKVVGYGETETGSKAVRMKASIPVLTSACLGRPYMLFCAPFLEIILADRSGGRPRDSCGGDSGGPVFAQLTVKLPNCSTRSNVKTITRRYDVLVGITSRAAPFTHAFSGKHCGGGGIYTLVGRRSVYSWLEQNKVKRQECLNEDEED